MCRYAPEYNLEQTGETYAQRAVATDRYRFGAPMPRLRRPLYLVGAISLAVLAGCASRASAPRGRHGRRAANHRDGPAWRQLRRQAGRHALQDRAFEQRRRRERQALEQPQRSQPDFRGPGAQAVRRRRRRRRDAGHAGGVCQVVLDAAAPLDQPSDSGAATSTPSTATPAPAPTPAENRRARPMPASSTGAGRPPARSPRASTTTPRASTSPATWATPSSRRPTARSCTAATACAAWAT